MIHLALPESNVAPLHGIDLTRILAGQATTRILLAASALSAPKCDAKIRLQAVRLMLKAVTMLEQLQDMQEDRA
jgi:hypothetical protein